MRSDLKRRNARTNSGIQRTRKNIPEKWVWDPCKIFQFWDYFPSADAMRKANWPEKLVFRAVRAKAVAILRLEGGARSADVTKASWLRITPEDWNKNAIPDQIKIGFKGLKGDALMQEFDKIRERRFFKSGTNSCLIKTLRELLHFRKTFSEELIDVGDPLFTALTPTTKNGVKIVRALSPQRLSNVVNLSLLCAGIRDSVPKELRHAASSKARTVGVSIKEILSHCVWSSESTFKKHYLSTVRGSNVPALDDPDFSTAVRIGVKSLEGTSKAIAMRQNVIRFLSLTSQDLNFSNKSSPRSLAELWGFKNVTLAAQKVVTLEMKGEQFSFRASSRSQSKLTKLRQ